MDKPISPKKHELTEEDGTNKYKHILKNEKFFTPFNDGELDELLESGEIKKYAINEYIIKEDNVDHTFFVILRGQVSIIKGTHANISRNIASLNEGNCFGEMAMLLDGHRSASVLAAVECILFKISGNEIKKMKLETQLKLYRQFAIGLASRLRETSETVTEQI